jgi:hypothetical protein
MPYRVTCPHCETALRVADEVPATAVTCPHCLGRIPNPGPVAAGSAGGAVLAVAVDDETRRDNRGTGCGVLLLVTLVAMGIAFGVSLAMSALRTAGRYGDNLFVVWGVVGGLGGLLVLCLTTYYVSRALSRGMAGSGEEPAGRNPLLGGVIVFVALLIGVLAALMVIGLTCGAILGGGVLGGGV